MLPFQDEKGIGCDKWLPKNWKQEGWGLEKAALAEMLQVKIGGRKGAGGGQRAGRGQLCASRAPGRRFGSHLYGSTVAVAKKEHVQIWAG